MTPEEGRDAVSGEAWPDCSLVGLGDRDGRVVGRAVCGGLALNRLTITGAATGVWISFPSPIPGVITSG